MTNRILNEVCTRKDVKELAGGAVAAKQPSECVLRARERITS